jgi:hypothetical protein
LKRFIFATSHAMPHEALMMKSGILQSALSAFTVCAAAFAQDCHYRPQAQQIGREGSVSVAPRKWNNRNGMDAAVPNA